MGEYVAYVLKYAFQLKKKTKINVIYILKYGIPGVRISLGPYNTPKSKVIISESN